MAASARVDAIEAGMEKASKDTREDVSARADRELASTG